MPSTKRKRTTKSASSSSATASPPTPPSPSAEKVAENDDVLTEILVHLPIKSIQRFKSVSKHWLSLISSPAFSARRVLHPTPISGFILKLSNLDVPYAGPEYDFVDPNKDDENLSNPPPFRSLTFVDEYRSGIEIVQSCNGLLLCRTSGVRELRRSYYVYNPATRNYFTLIPRPQIRRGKSTAKISTIFRISLAFDPSKSPHYKVVCLRKCEEIQGRFRIEIYSSETRSWRPSSVGSFAAEFNFAFAGGVYSNGSVHWINPWCPSLRFDVDEDRLCEMPMPAVPQDNDLVDDIPCDGGFAFFGESRGHLHLVYHRFEPGMTCFNVYETKEDYSGWFVKYRVDLSEVSAAFPEMVPRYSVIPRPPMEDYNLAVLCIVRGEHEEDSYMVMYVPGSILRYNFKSETFCKLCDIEPNHRFHNSQTFSRWSEAYQYIESLASV